MTQPAPFYGFFTTTRLVPFTVEQAATMLATLAAHQGEDATADYLQTDQATRRLRAVAHLAGGQPRIWALLAQALTIAGLEQLVTLLLSRFDELTPYYQARLAFQLKSSRGAPIPLIVEFLKNWFDPSDLAPGSVAGDELAKAYLQQAAMGQESDPILALSRRLYALPASRVPILDLIGRLDDACARLLDGDPEPLLQVPSALRAVIEGNLPLDTFEPSAIHAMRIRLHSEALNEFGHFPHRAGKRWLERAQNLVTSPETRESGFAVLAVRASC